MTTAIAPSPVDALAERFWERFLELQPLWATVLGDERWDDRWDDPGPAGRALERAQLEELLRDDSSSRRRCSSRRSSSRRRCSSRR